MGREYSWHPSFFYLFCENSALPYITCGNITKHRKARIICVIINKMKKILLKWSATDFHSLYISDSSSMDLPFFPIIRIWSNGVASGREIQLSSTCLGILWTHVAVCVPDIWASFSVANFPSSPLQAQRNEMHFIADLSHFGTARGCRLWQILTVITCISRFMPQMAKMVVI